LTSAASNRLPSSLLFPAGSGIFALHRPISPSRSLAAKSAKYFSTSARSSDSTGERATVVGADGDWASEKAGRIRLRLKASENDNTRNVSGIELPYFELVMGLDGAHFNLSYSLFASIKTSSSSSAFAHSRKKFS